MAAKPLTDIEARPIIANRIFAKRGFFILKRRGGGNTYAMNNQLKTLKKMDVKVKVIK